MTTKTMRNYKYRLYPNKTQEAALLKMFWVQRTLYNAALEERIGAYKKCGVTVTKYDQSYQLKDIRAENEDVAFCPSTMSAATLDTLDKAYQAFFRRVKRGEKAGFPRFKGRDRFTSVGLVYNMGATITKEKKLRMMNVGELKIKWHRELPDDVGIKRKEGIKTIRIMRESTGKWFVVFAVETHFAEKKHMGEAVGVDVGISSFVTLSNGEKIESPKYFREMEKKLRVQQRSLSRKKRGGKRRKKAAIQVAKTHEKIKNQRDHFLHTSARQMVEKYSVIAVEKLSIKNMVKNNKLSKSIADAGWGRFFDMMDYKGKETGSEIKRVDPRNTSQLCFNCGSLPTEKITLSVRQYRCEHCGFICDRDENAAKNILSRAQGKGCVDPSDAKVSR